MLKKCLFFNIYYMVIFQFLISKTSDLRICPWVKKKASYLSENRIQIVYTFLLYFNKYKKIFNTTIMSTIV